MKRILTVLTLWGLLVCSLFPAETEKTKPPVPLQTERIAPDNPRGDRDQKLPLVRRLMRAQNYEGASALLEAMYEETPDDPVIVNLLLACYDRLGYMTKSETLARRLVELFPNNVTYRIKLAEALAKQGKDEEAKAAYREALARLHPRNIQNLSAYRMVFRSMMRHEFDDMALALIDSVRSQREDPTRFALERGTILERRNQYRAATGEFFAVLNDSGRVARDAENKLLSLLEYPESSDTVEQTLLELTAADTSSRAARILTSFYLKAERFDRAFEFAVMQDSLEGGNGTMLLNFVHRCQERKLYREAARMAEYILSRYQNQPLANQTYLLYADALTKLGRYDEAIKVYDTLVVLSPRAQDKAEALYLIGDIYLNYLQDYPRALAVFDSVVNNYQAGMGYLNARLAIPFCYLRQGKLTRARSAFSDMLQRRLNNNIKEEVEYYLALLLFFEKKFDSSRVALRKLLVDHPRGFYVNDAVQLLLVMDEAESAPEVLYDYSNALLFEQRRMPDSVEAKLLRIVQDKNKALADVALYRLALLSMERSDSAKAVAYIDQLSKEFSDSYYLPYGLKIKADILVAHPEEVGKAKEIYRLLLEKYPNYPFISNVRERMRQLEGSA
jgi:tetratricopeptide (TPR) repeat protein